MSKDGEDHDKRMVSDVEVVQSLGGREMLNSMRDGICVCVVVVTVLVVVAGLMVALTVVVLMVAVRVVVLVILVRVSCIGVVGVVGTLCIGVVEVDCAEVVDILVLGGIFMVEVLEEVELVVRCVVRLVLCCANGKEYFLCYFSLMSVEMNGLSVGGYHFGMVIWADCFVLFERGFLGKMVGTDVLMDMVEVVVVEAVDVVRAGSFVFFRCGCLGYMTGVRVVIEVICGVGVGV